MRAYMKEEQLNSWANIWKYVYSVYAYTLSTIYGPL